MDLERGASELRPRGAYEAVDFGFRLVKPHYLQLLATAAVAVGPLLASNTLLGADVAPIDALPTFTAASLSEPTSGVKTRQSIAAYFYLAALAFLLLGLVLRRI